MSYTINSTEVEPCKVKVEYTADTKVLKDKRDEVVSRFRKLPVPGFRLGKATDSAIRNHFKSKIKELLQQEMLNHAVEDILFETKINVFAQPQPLSASLDGNNFRAEVLLFKTPDFELKPYKYTLPNPVLPSTDEVVEQTLQNLRERAADVLPYEENDFIELGDTVTLDYSVFKNEELVSSEEGKLYNVGDNLLPDFDVNICGMMAGDSREFYSLDNKVTVQLHMGMKKVPAPLDDTLAQRFNLDSLDVLRASTRASIEANQEQNRLNVLKEQIKNLLLSDNQLSVPLWLSVGEAKNIASQERVSWDELNDQVRASYIKRAEEAISLVFILGAIRKTEPETELTDSEALELVKQVLKQNGVQDIDQYISYASNNGTLPMIFNQIKNDYVMNWLAKHTTTTE
jgi:FKBP-type peptidyl-prolyl cis-trans isomerase (trigger factor)